MPRVVPSLRGPFTVDNYHRMAETGVLRPDARVELLDGLVVEMSPIGSRHADCVDQLAELLIRTVGRQARVRVQNPVVLDDRSEPQPDVALLRRRAGGYAAGHPRPADVILLIEVMDTSADRDREVKIPLYARSGIPEVWLVDLQADMIEVFLEPGEDGYAVVRTLRRGETLTPSLLPSATLSVAEVLG